jgi:hypothetical protein
MWPACSDGCLKIVHVHTVTTHLLGPPCCSTSWSSVSKAPKYGSPHMGVIVGVHACQPLPPGRRVKHVNLTEAPCLNRQDGSSCIFAECVPKHSLVSTQLCRWMLRCSRTLGRSHLHSQTPFWLPSPQMCHPRSSLLSRTWRCCCRVQRRARPRITRASLLPRCISATPSKCAVTGRTEFICVCCMPHPCL